MNSVYLPALAALSGSAIGGLTSFASAWLTRHHQDRARRLLGEKVRRQKLYKQFIDEASKLYADALVHDRAELSALVSVYALISRMRVVSSPAVIEKAEANPPHGVSSIVDAPYHFSPKGRISSSKVQALFGC